MLGDYSVDVAKLNLRGPIILSAHHCFGSPGLSKDYMKAEWEHTKRWAGGITVDAVLVIDEPKHNGIPQEQLDYAISLVRVDGYRTFVTETVQYADQRPNVDYFGVTCYDWPGIGSHTLDQCITYYQDHPEWNVVIGQGFDWQPRSGTVTAQMNAWLTLRRPVFYWVWAWDGQEGIRDNPEALAVYRSH